MADVTAYGFIVLFRNGHTCEIKLKKGQK